jgi:glutathione S-transferase
VDRGRTRAVAFFDRLDDQLENGAYVTGEQFSMADITAYVMVEFGEWSKIAIKDSQTNLQRWYDTVSKRPGMRA